MTQDALRLSATVLLVRGEEDLKVLMVQRHYEIDFASGALVFPGGKVCADDWREGWLERTDGDFTGQELAARVSAVREVFEESGLLMARPEASRGEGQPLVGKDISEPLEAHREAVDRQEMSFLDMMEEHGLVLALDRLVPFAHWITPEFMPKRFDTYFYIARAPDKQIASHDGRETTDAIWIDPEEALGRAERGEATIIFPTRMNVELLSRCRTVEDALEAARSRDVVTVLPVVDKGPDGAVLRIPAEAGYCVTEEPLETIRKEQTPKPPS